MDNQTRKSEGNHRITLVYGKHPKSKKEYCWRVSDKTTLPEGYTIQEDDFLHVETVDGIAPMRVTRTEKAEENEQTLMFSCVICKPDTKPANKKRPKKHTLCDTQNP